MTEEERWVPCTYYYRARANVDTFEAARATGLWIRLGGVHYRVRVQDYDTPRRMVRQYLRGGRWCIYCTVQENYKEVE